jgi:methylase of polypeptide subunit release factors
MVVVPEFQLADAALPVGPDSNGSAPSRARADEALITLGRSLHESGYHFTTVTPATHGRVMNRPYAEAATVTDIFGWSRPFRPSILTKSYLHLLEAADALRISGNLLRSTVRFSTLGAQLFVHSAFPTDEPDAVFFGPDTYRFARILNQLIASTCSMPSRILDVGAGSGAGGLQVASLLPRGTSLVLSDINRCALRYCRINAALNDLTADVVESDLFDALSGSFDLIVANPPYLVDSLSRLYRHGGGELGEGLGLAIVSQGIDRLAPGGRILLYTGTAIVDGNDRLHEALRSMLKNRPLRLWYEEIDPDVFGEELDNPPYDRADRIAVVAATIESIGAYRGTHESDTLRLDPLGRRT